ncbi:hypothetical protein H5410_056120 [Solanum commersonii]|uniref:Uncharacterized protein n=1 Tax=Solanum commersonii TaxID=4109 RepID=A0A9J5WKC4_SOLCO|nr:hypothetical protein H5410_056120 [Solanum commersonii]
MDMLILFGVTGLLRVLPHVETFNIIFASVNGRGLDFKLVICVTTTIGVRSSFLTRQAFFDYWCEASGLYEPPNSLACPSRVDQLERRKYDYNQKGKTILVSADEFAEFSQYREFLKEFTSVTTLVDVKLWNLGPSKQPPLPYYLY